MKGYKHIGEFKVLAEKVSEILDGGNLEDLEEHLKTLLEYNEKNREAIISECKEIDGKEENS
jgi:DNA-binding SARP family transcriptional activator